MIQKIKTWFYNCINYREKRKRKQTLEIIKKAKQLYLEKSSPFMCICFCKAECDFFEYRDIITRIPEFKPSTFGLNEDNIYGTWWLATDRESRIRAFDKLIEIYSK